MEKAILDKEMTVVRNEFEMGEKARRAPCSSAPSKPLYVAHYGHMPIGSRSDIENVPIDARAFYRKYTSRITPC